jgi:uncharacterized protein (DUF3820 family)
MSDDRWNKQKWEMPFGRHKGTLIEDVPVEYCEWLVGEMKPRGKKDWLKKALRRRIDIANGDILSETVPAYIQYEGEMPETDTVPF